MYNLCCNEIKQIVDYISERRSRGWLRTYTKDEITTFVLERIKESEICVVYERGQITGVVFFCPNRSGEFWVDQIWASNRRAILCFLAELKKRFPAVNLIRGWRRKHTHLKQIKHFKVQTLVKIFNPSLT
jgi:hypothetical protein